MARKATQETFDVFKQKKIAEVERAADVLDEKRDLVAGLKGELKAAVLKLKQAIHKHQKLLDKQESPKGEQVFKYVRGDYRVTLTLKEDVAVKIGENPKEPNSDAAPGEDDQHFEQSIDDVDDPALAVEVKK